MIQMQLKQNSNLIFRWNLYSGTMKDAAVFNGKLILFVQINLQFFWDTIFRLLTMQNVVHHLRENGIPMRGFVDLRHHDWCLFHLNAIHLISLDTPIIWLFHDLSWQNVHQHWHDLWKPSILYHTDKLTTLQG